MLLLFFNGGGIGITGAPETITVIGIFGGANLGISRNAGRPSIDSVADNGLGVGVASNPSSAPRVGRSSNGGRPNLA